MFKLMLMKSYLEGGIGVSVLCATWKGFLDLDVRYVYTVVYVWHEKCLLLIMIAECQMKILLKHEIKMWVLNLNMCEINVRYVCTGWCGILYTMTRHNLLLSVYYAFGMNIRYEKVVLVINDISVYGDSNSEIVL